MVDTTNHIQYTTKTTNSLAKDLTVFVGLVVNGILDVGILNNAARELVAQWPILGGQLITKTNPYSFKSGQSIDFKSREIDTPVDKYLPVNMHVNDSDVPIYKNQLQGTAAEKVFHFDALRPLNLLPKSLFTIRVTLLQDATLLGFRMPHHFCDGESIYHVVKAYRDLIAGEKIPTLIPPPDVDHPLSEILKNDTNVTLPAGVGLEGVPYLDPNENLLLGFPAWIRYVGYAVGKMIGAKLGLSANSEEKFIHLPGKLVESWRTECQKELEQTTDSEHEDVPILSNLDVITAWFLQTSFRATPPDNGPLDLMYNYSYRFALALPSPNTRYLKNSYYELRLHWASLSSFQASTLASLAVAIRKTVLRNKQASIIRAHLQFQEQHIKELVAPGAKGTRLAFLPFVSSWTTFPYHGMDFSAAVAAGVGKDGEEGKAVGDGKVVFVQPRVALPLGVMVDPLAIVLKDGEGGYWLRANLSKTGWKGHGQ